MKLILTTIESIKIKIWILVAMVAYMSPKLYAQFPTIGSASPVTITTPTVVGQSVTSAPVRYGQYIVLPNLGEGRTYQIETCDLTTDDMQLYIFVPFSGNYFANDQNDDGCNLQSKILFTPESSQSYRCAPYKYYNDSSVGSTPIKITLINNAAPLSATMSASKPCFGDNLVLISVAANGGTPPYTYDWSNGVGTKNYIVIPQTRSKVYSATIKDAANNTTTASVTVEGIYKNTVTLTSGILTADQAGASYTWLDCNNANQPIAGATAQSFTPTVSGSYAVRVSLNDCVDTSSCINMTVTGIHDKSTTKAYKIFPNPAQTSVIIQANEIIKNIKLTDITGRIVKQLSPNQSSVNLNIEDMANGLYLLNINEGETVTKFIKN